MPDRSEGDGFTVRMMLSTRLRSFLDGPSATGASSGDETTGCAEVPEGSVSSIVFPADADDRITSVRIGCDAGQVRMGETQPQEDVWPTERSALLRRLLLTKSDGCNQNNNTT